MSASSLSHLASRERLPRPSRDYTLRSPSRLAARSHSRRRPARCRALASSVGLSFPIFPHLRLLLPLDPPRRSIRLRAAPHRVGGNTVQLLPSRSFARSFLSVIPAVRLVLCPSPSIRLTFVSLSPPSSYNLLLSRGAPRFSRDRRDDTRMRAPSSLPAPCNGPPSRPAVFYADSWHEFRSALQYRDSREKSRDHSRA